METSVILKEIPGDLDSAREYLEHLHSLDGVADVRIAIPDGSNIEIEPEWCGVARSLGPELLTVVVTPFCKTPAQRLNVAAASAETDNLLILERVYWLNGSFVENALTELDRHARAIVSPKGFYASLDHSVPVAAQLETADATPLDEFALGYLLVMRKRDFLLFRGFDEEKQFAYYLCRELEWRIRNYGWRVLHPKKVCGYTTQETTQYLRENGLPTDRSQIQKGICSDSSVFRNLIDWSVAPELRVPLITVAIATKNRSDLLVESLNSVLYQSFQDFEIIVADDGSDDQQSVQRAVDSVGDSRVTLIQVKDSVGVSRIRNLIADHSHCELTAVHDDDDIMLPDRLLLGISALGGDADASYGSWINFDDETGQMRGFLTQIGFDDTLVAAVGAAPGHSTWTLPTQLIKQFRYNEKITSSVDHDLATRLVNAGVRWKHTGEYLYLRRVHEFQITAQDSSNQKTGHLLSKIRNRFTTNSLGFEKMVEKGKKKLYPKPRGQKDIFSNFGGFLPDKLVDREVSIRGNTANRMLQAQLSCQNARIILEKDLLTSRPTLEQSFIARVSQEQLVHLRGSVSGPITVAGRLKPSQSAPAVSEIDRVEADAKLSCRNTALDRVVVLYGSACRIKQDCHVVVDWGAPYSAEDLVSPDLPVPFFAREVEVAEELGIHQRVCVYAYENLSDALICMYHLRAEKEASTDRSISLYREGKPFDVAYETVRLLENEEVRASSNDSGLDGEQ